MKVPDIICQTDRWVAVNKPSGMVVHRSRGANDRHTLVSTMRAALGDNVFPVNRLDRPTSGVILMARDKDAARELSEAFAERTVEKTYEAVVRGWPQFPEDSQEILIERELTGKQASTRVQLLCQCVVDEPLSKHKTTRLSRVVCFPKTGLFHQIRRHLRGLGYPIVNDRKHGDDKLNHAFLARYGVKRMLLHSRSLTFPFQGESFTATANWNGRSLGLLQYLGLNLPEETLS